ncbi:MAG: VOC family protein [Acidobacteria bacterium]|nr:VOC family protein [Acidobacteriota bacterium]
MANKVTPIPAGHHSVTAYLTLDDCSRAIDFYKRAFGAQEIMRMDGPAGKIGHAEIKIGDSVIMLADEMPGAGNRAPKSLGGSTGGIFLYVHDVDSSYKRAVDAGARADTPPADMFWGDRFGRLTDPFGHTWALATHKEDVAPEEMRTRMQQEMAKQGRQTRSAV